MKFIKLTKLKYDGSGPVTNDVQEIFVRKSVINKVQKAEGRYARHKTTVTTSFIVLEVMEEVKEILDQLEEPDETNLTNDNRSVRFINNAIPLPLSSRFDDHVTNVESISVPDATGTSSD